MSLSQHELEKMESQLIADFNKGEFETVIDSDDKKKAAKKAAKNYLRRNNSINIRLSSADLDMVKKLAIQEGLAYQSFIASIVHKFVAGRFKSI